MNSYETFAQLHQNSEPFVLGNTWDVPSAKAFETAGYKAIGTSSHAISNGFGYSDGENLPFDLLLRVAKRVTETVKIPFSVDMEGGFSRNIKGIIANIEKLHDAGVAGINIEDTITDTSRKFLPVGTFRETLLAITDYLSGKNIKLFINVRTDGFLLGLTNALEETLTRIKTYETTGINGIFVPCITRGSDIKTVVDSTRLPVNVMCMPNLPDFDELTSLGVKRVSMGPFLFNKVYTMAEQLATAVLQNKNFNSIIS